MNDVIAKPETIDDLQAVIKDRARVIPVGNQTKLPLCSADGAEIVSLANFRGITQYEPSEFTFTAKACTPLSEINAVLAEKGQYLPFDPLLSCQGATLGGTVAAGLSGPGRQRYGGIRDFLLGVQFLSSDGAVINSGGKVVKNAAGFDIPKLLVGSLGRLGIMTELTFKVFPRPVATKTLRISCASHQQALERIARSATSRWEPDAIDYVPGAGVWIRLCGPVEANDALADEINSEWPGDVAEVESAEAETFWRNIGELEPRSATMSVAKIPTTPAQFLDLQSLFESGNDMRCHLSVAGAVTWVWSESDESLQALDQHLAGAGHSGLLIIGNRSRNKWLGQRNTSEMEQRICAAMDPEQKFLPLE